MGYSDHIKNKINFFLQKYGYEIIRKEKNDDLLKNIFKTNHNKRVLISYLTHPFTQSSNYSHTNYFECKYAGEIFSEIGYNVDVINYDSDIELDYTQYDVIYGQGKPFDKAPMMNRLHKNFKILYGTGTCNYYFTKVATNCFNDFYKKTKQEAFNSVRLNMLSNIFGAIRTNAIIALGNDYCLKTYTDFNKVAMSYNLDAFYFNKYDINISQKIIKTARNNFLWFGSGGLLYKGLGLTIEYFLDNPQYTLHICGANNSEIEFWNYYREKINSSSNIINHGFVNLESSDFKKIMDVCGVAIFPSVSEGGSPSLLNVMANGGLIPIALPACTIDIENYGFYMNDFSKVSIQACVKELETISDGDFMEKMHFIKEDVRSKYTVEKYRSNLKEIIQKIIQKHHTNE